MHSKSPVEREAAYNFIVMDRAHEMQPQSTGKREWKVVLDFGTTIRVVIEYHISTFLVCTCFIFCVFYIFSQYYESTSIFFAEKSDEKANLSM